MASSLTFDQFYSFFGLRENPFHVSPDPRFYYSSPGHDAAFSELLYSIQTRKGMTVLTGEAGTGKTMLVNRLLDWLRDRNLSSAYVFHSLLRPSDLFEFIARDFGIPCESPEKGAVVDALHKWLLRRHAASDTPVVILDEAQALSTNTLDELRLLLNLETAGGKLMHIVLVGQPELDAKLQRHQLRQLRQRIMFRCRLPLLSWEQTADYVSARLSAAGANTAEARLFPRETVRALHGYSRGIPRVINLLCEHALLAAYSDRHHSISPTDIHAAAAKFDLVHDPIPAEDTFPMSTRMSLFLSPEPPASEGVAALESLQITQQVSNESAPPDAQRSTEMLPIFPVPAPVPMTTETILSLAPPSRKEPVLEPAADGPLEDVPPAAKEPHDAISEPKPPVEESVEETVTAELTAPAMDADMQHAAADPVVAANWIVSPNSVTSADRIIEPAAEFAEAVSESSAAFQPEPNVTQELMAATLEAPLEAGNQTRAVKPVSRLTSGMTAASERFAAASRQVVATSKRIAEASKHFALASKSVVPPNVGASIARYCRGVADSFVRDVRLWMKPPNPTRHANEVRSAAAREESSQSVHEPPVPASPVASVAKWLQEPMPASLQANGNHNSSRKGRRARRAGKQPPRSAQKS